MPPLAHDRYIDEIARQVAQTRDVVTSGADLSAPVPTCPDWRLEELVCHLGGALRWVAATIAGRAQERIPNDEVPEIAGPGPGSAPAVLDAWFAHSGRLVVDALREAGPDTEVWAWADDRSSGFWARRMAHEITVHRADATLAAGLPYEVAPDIAADAIDEWLELVEWVQHNMAHDPARDMRGPDRSIHLHATDAPPGLDAEWLIRLDENGVRHSRGHARATVALRGPLTSVLLAFYRRLPLDSPELEVVGERGVLEFWLERTAFG
ncbi:maleylpyruvate isomerase family mycothiol-dependent enzyme [Streptomyces sp. NPDC001508]|uniref:maleylpyruvate isomerase family mycothiol-dependent enzyme n=1 Tax=Streptomyces sp. NPDC001508 TaxID=3154656 RepID=UPI00332602D5